EAQPVGTGQDTDRESTAGTERAKDAVGSGEDHEPREDQVDALHPSVLSERQQTQRVPGEVEAGPSEPEDEAHHDVERTGDDAPTEKAPSDRGTAIENGRIS